MTSPASPNTLSASNIQVLPPLLTDNSVKPSQSAKDRLSTYSNISFVSQQNRSRPGSHVFPIFHSSLPYALVRDFAYPSIHPLHYGPPPPHASGVSTPASEYRRLSDPPTSWDTSKGPWATMGGWNAESTQGHQQLPAMSFGDGPPYSEDEDLHSPVVTSSRQRKKSTGNNLNGMVDEHGMLVAGNATRGTFVGLNPDGSETYYVNGGDGAGDGPGGEYVTYPANEGRYSVAYGGQPGYAQESGFESEDEYARGDRYSNDYQFAVGCPDEEMHGKAVALFDFVREHENELPLTEGQVIYVSYRHGEGWLVAEDPKTGENGLVPEQFVRLLRDIEGGLTSLNGEPNLDVTEGNLSTSMHMVEDEHVSTPTQDNPGGTNGDAPLSVSVGNTDQSQSTSETGKTVRGSDNRSSMMKKT
ncbi:NAP1-binding protein 2 [Penicillium rolfsii]|nr:NAP1-binding protein 2 [Penicillium rolfsii]